MMSITLVVDKHLNSIAKLCPNLRVLALWPVFDFAPIETSFERLTILELNWETDLTSRYVEFFKWFPHLVELRLVPPRSFTDLSCLRLGNALPKSVQIISFVSKISVRCIKALLSCIKLDVLRILCATAQVFDDCQREFPCPQLNPKHLYVQFMLFQAAFPVFIDGQLHHRESQSLLTSRYRGIFLTL